MSTAGVRRAIHAASAAIAVLAVVSPPVLRLGTAYLAVTVTLLEVLRLRFEPAATFLSRLVPVYREHERLRPSGAWWLVVAYAVCAWFPYPEAVAGILAGGLADPMGALVGSRLDGRAPKSVAGSVAVASTSIAVTLAVGVPPTAALGAGLAAAAVERWPGPLDDNLLVGPVTSAVALLLA